MGQKKGFNAPVTVLSGIDGIVDRTIFVIIPSHHVFAREQAETALCWTLSNASTSSTKIIWDPGPSSMFKNRAHDTDLYNVENAWSGFDKPTVLWTKPNNLLA